MRRRFGTGVIVVALVSLGSGVAKAEPLALADVARSIGTEDGYVLTSSLTDMTINSVPNMAATAFTREGFVTGKATVTVDSGSEVPFTSASLVLGVQLGCQVDLSDGVELGIGDEEGILGGVLNDLIPSISVTLLPGSITSLSLGKKSVKGRIGKIFVHDAHVNVDGCGGPVSIRFFATATLSTDISDESVNAYGDILTL